MQEATQQGDYFYYLEEEYDALVERLRELERQHKEFLGQFGQMRSAQLYDINSELAELQRDERRADIQAQALRIKLRHARIAPAAIDDGRLGFRKLVTLADESDKATEWLIVGYEGTDCNASPPRLAYTAPCLRELWGKRVGESNDKFEIVAMRLPEPALLRMAA